MSTTSDGSDPEHEHEEAKALGPRYDWWYEETGHPGHDEASDDTPAGHATAHTRMRAEWLAHHLLKETAEELVCPIALEEPPDSEGAVHDANRAVPVTEPTAYVPPSGTPTREAGAGDGYDRTRPYRVNEEHGYLTGVAIPDRPAEEFLAIVELVLQDARERRGLRAETAQRIRQLARERKHHAHVADGSDRSDVAIMTEVLTAIERPQVLEAAGV